MVQLSLMHCPFEVVTDLETGGVGIRQDNHPCSLGIVPYQGHFLCIVKNVKPVCHQNHSI